MKYKLLERKKHKLKEINKNFYGTYLRDLCIDDFEFIELLSLVSSHVTLTKFFILNIHRKVKYSVI